MGEPLLVVRGLSVSHAPRVGGARKTVLHALDLDVAAGEAVAIVGESGAGKSTLVQAVLGVLPSGARIDAGSIRWRGEELVGASERVLRRVRGRAIGVAFQDALAAFDPVRTIGAQIAEVLRAHGDASVRPDGERVLAALARCVATDPARTAKSFPHELSGGMRQRAQLALVLAPGPELVLADEPTSGLDPTLALAVLEVLARERAERGTALVYVTHDLALARETTDRVLVLRDGRVVETGVTRDVLARPSHAATKELVDARRRLSSRSERAP